MRFRTKTIIGVAVIEMALLAVLVGSTLAVLRESNESALKSRAQLGGKLLAAAAKDSVISQDLATLDSLAIESVASGQIDFVRILDAHGAVLAERGDPKLLSRSFQSHTDTRIDQVMDGVFDMSTPLMAGGIQYGEVQIGVSTDNLNLLLASARRWAAGIAVLEMLLVALFSWLLGSYLVRQLVAMREASQHFASGDFLHRVPVRGSDELAETALTFNRMAQQLGDSYESLRAENFQRLEAQHAAEQARARAEDRNEQLNVVFALSPDGFLSFDSRHRVKYASPAFSRLTGLAEAVVIGLEENALSEKLAAICISSFRFPSFDSLLAQSEPKPGSMPSRHLIELSGPGKRVLEVGLRLSTAESVSQILFFRDVTYETEVDRMKSEFLAIAAHELRTPMASIYGFAEVLLMEEHDEETRRELLTIVHQQAEIMAKLINELLDLARIEARQGKDFFMEDVAVEKLVADAVASFGVPAGRDAPDLTPPAAPLFVRADRNKMQQVMTNLLSNAYKYSLDGGVSISFQTRMEGDRHSVGIDVRDLGIGMTPEQQARVCERFYRAEASGKIPGAGLGMSIVKEIVELHGGEIAINSRLGFGSTVTIWMPVINFWSKQEKSLCQ
jgi:signal transduction histidine kinase